MKKNPSRVFSLVTRIFNVRWWSDYDRIKAFNVYLVNGVKKIVSMPNNEPSKTNFNRVVASMQLTENELLAKKNNLLRTSLWMCSFAIILLVYMFYQLATASYLAVLVSFVLVLVAGALAFRYHFWYFQIKNRKLGCSLKEWYKQGIRGEKNE